MRFGTSRQLRTVSGAIALVVGLLAMTGSASAAACKNTDIVITGYQMVNLSGLRTTPSPDMTGRVLQGDALTVHFTIKPAVTSCTASLVSYTAPGPTAANLSEQRVYQQSSGEVGPGDWSATVKVPSCYFQTDFVRGAPITQFSSTVTYTKQGRLLDYANGGTEACGIDDTTIAPALPPSQDVAG